MWVSFKNKNKILFLSKTSSGSDSERRSTHRWSRSSPSTPPKASQSYTSSWDDISFSNIKAEGLKMIEMIWVKNDLG